MATQKPNQEKAGQSEVAAAHDHEHGPGCNHDHDHDHDHEEADGESVRQAKDQPGRHDRDYYGAPTRSVDSGARTVSADRGARSFASRLARRRAL